MKSVRWYRRDCVPIWKMNFCSRFLRLSVLPWCREKPQIVTCWLEWLGRLKCRATGLDASLSFLSTSRRCSRKRSPRLLPVSPMYIFLQKVHVMQYITISILIDCLVPVILSALRMKGQVSHRLRAHLKVPGWSSDLSTLLTRKFLKFLSRSNEINGSCEKILPVSLSFWSNSKFFKIMFLAARLCGWQVSVNGILSFFSFCDVCSADCRSICWVRCLAVLTTESG